MSTTTIVFRVLLVVVLAAIAAAVGLAVSAGQKKEYQASTDLVFESFAAPELGVLGAGFVVGGPDANRRTAADIVMLQSRDVAVATARANPGLGYTPNEIRAHISAHSPGPVDLIRLTARAGSPSKARALVLAYRKQYKLLRREREQKRARSAARALEGELARLSPRLRANARGDVLRDQIGQLEVISKIGTGLPVVTDGAYAQAAAVAPQTSRNVLFGLLFGALLGVGLLVLRSAAMRERVVGSPVGQQGDIRSDWE
jgi:capsular polysaccharide biosynthesis protein